MTYTIKINKDNAAKLRPMCEATRYHPARLANMLIEYALQRAKLTPTTDTVYDLRFWDGSTAPSIHNTRQLLPQLSNLRSGIDG